MYHVSFTDLGYRVWLEPRDPSTPGPNELHMPSRVCFSPTVKQALRAKAGYRSYGSLFCRLAGQHHFFDILLGCLTNPTVYQTQQTKGFIAASDLEDYDLSQECFALGSVLCYRVGFISLKGLKQNQLTLTQNRIEYVGEQLAQQLGY